MACEEAMLARVELIVAEVHESPAIPHTREDLVALLASHGFTAELYDEHVRSDVRTCMAWFRRA